MVNSDALGYEHQFSNVQVQPVEEFSIATSVVTETRNQSFNQGLGGSINVGTAKFMGSNE
jgi:hypothetical protein